MKKRIFVLFLVAILLLTFTACSKKSDKAVDTAGKPEDTSTPTAQTETVWLVSKANYYIDGNLESWGEYTYDQNGNVICKTIFNADGSREARYEYVYYENGSLESVTQYNSEEKIRYQSCYDEDGKLTSWSEYQRIQLIRFEYTYDEHGNQTLRTKYNEKGDQIQRTEIVNVYDDNSNRISETYYDANGNYLARNEYTYDANNQISMCSYDENNVLVDMYEYVYDANGNQTKKTFACMEDGTWILWIESVYNKSGKMLCETKFDADGNPLSQEEHTYDENGNELCWILNQSGFYVHDVFAYDENGNQISETHYDENGNQTEHYTFENVYDNNQCLIKHTYKNSVETFEYTSITVSSERAKELRKEQRKLLS